MKMLYKIFKNVNSSILYFYVFKFFIKLNENVVLGKVKNIFTIIYYCIGSVFICLVIPFKIIFKILKKKQMQYLSFK